MCRTARQIFACGVVAVVFLIARPTRAIETCNPVSTPMTTLACKEGVKGNGNDSINILTHSSPALSNGKRAFTKSFRNRLF